ncbi:MAG: hypothetical protein K0U93_05860, partial [Gammaproteobacteria bacterium]|nr:hypothetical protein [Gammaproteobacteria bacterium]
FHAPENAPSDFMRGLARQDLLGYAFAAFLLNEHGLRVLPSLSAQLTLRIQPPYVVTDDSTDKLIAGLTALAEVVMTGDFYGLTAHLVGESATPPRRIKHRPRIDEPPPQGVNRVGFVAHFIEPEHIRSRDHSLESLPTPHCAPYVQRVSGVVGPACYERGVIRSITGDTVHFSFFGLPQTSRDFANAIADRKVSELRARVQEGVDLAMQSGCQVIGLGGFTSIVTNNCRSLDSPGVALTSGNSLTVMMALEALLEAAKRRQIRTSEARLATLGATGNIGEVFCELAAEHVGSIALIGRPRSDRTGRLERLGARLWDNALTQLRNHQSGELQGIARTVSKQMHEMGETDFTRHNGAELFALSTAHFGLDAAVVVTDAKAALATADLVLGASSAAEPLITTDLIPRKPIVICDISTPPDTHPAVAKLPNVTAIGGGLVELPCNAEFSIGGVALEPGVVFACMAESMVLGLSGILQHYSYGPVEASKVHRITALAKLHGFRLARSKALWPVK